MLLLAVGLSLCCFTPGSVAAEAIRAKAIHSDKPTSVRTVLTPAIVPRLQLAQASADALPAEASEEAPSPLWLIVMPAIPLVGGGLIYVKRRFLTSG